MTPFPRRLGAALVVVALVGGCGGGSEERTAAEPTAEETAADDLSDLSADELWDRTRTHLEEAGTISMIGTLEQDGETYDLDAYVLREGDLEAVLSQGDASATVRVVGDQFYVRANPEFFRLTLGDEGESEQAIESVLGTVADRWLTTQDEAAQDDFGGLDRETILEDFEPDGELVLEEGRQIDGITTIGLGDDTGTLFVDAETGAPVLLDDEEGTVRLSFTERPAPKVPSGDVLDIDDLA